MTAPFPLDLVHEGIFHRLPIGIGVFSAGPLLVMANPAFCRLVGLPSAGPPATGMPLDGILPPPLSSAIDRAMRGAAPPSGPEIVRHTIDGEPRVWEAQTFQLPSRKGEPGQAVMLLSDVTARERGRESVRLFHESFLTSSNAIEVTDANGFLVDVNPAFERIYGYRREELIGRRPNVVSGAATPQKVYEELWRDITDPARGYWSGQIVNQDRAGNERPVFLTISAVRNDEGVTTHYVGVAVDLSERVAWERQAAHSDRLASLGQLAAGVAHEINTPLANVMLITESIRRRSTETWLKSRLDTISGQVEVAARIVRGLLDFARRSEPRMAPIDLVATARDAATFLRGKQSPDVDLIEEYPVPEAPIVGDRSQILQVLTNLLNNAYEAIDGPGRIHLTVRPGPSGVEVEVRDSGPGLSPDALRHTFEPFFTTKPEGKGTGLGLAICHGIMQAHHGTIVAGNAPDGGATFTLTFPAPSRELPHGTPSEAPLRAVRGARDA